MHRSRQHKAPRQSTDTKACFQRILNMDFGAGILEFADLSLKISWIAIQFDSSSFIWIPYDGGFGCGSQQDKWALLTIETKSQRAMPMLIEEMDEDYIIGWSVHWLATVKLG